MTLRPGISRSRRLLLIAALVVYVLVAFLCLHTLIFEHQTHVAGYDYFFYHWTLWWTDHALTTDGLTVYTSDYLMAPYESNFGYNSLTAVWYPVWKVLEPLTGTLTTLTAIIVIGCTLNGFVLFVFLLNEDAHPGLALIGGLALQVFPIARYFYYNSHINLMDWFWLPAHLLIWGRVIAASSPHPCSGSDSPSLGGIRESRNVRTAQHRRAVNDPATQAKDHQWPSLSPLTAGSQSDTGARFSVLSFLSSPVLERRVLPVRLIGWAVVQGIGFWGLFLTDLQFPIFVTFLLLPYGLLTLGQTARRGRAVVVRLIAAGLIAVMVAGLLLWFAGPLPQILDFDAELTPSPVAERPVIAFPDGFLGMSATWWDWATPSLSAFVTLGALLTVIAALIQWRKLGQGDRWFWLLVLIPPFMLAIGPDMTIGGTTIPMPFRVMYDLTGGNFRMPWRLAPVFVVAATVLAVKVWTPLLPRISARRVWLLVSLILLLTISVRLYETGPLQPLLPEYDMYAAMGRETGDPYDDYVVLEVPTGAGTGEVLLGDESAIAFQFYGITHHKRMFNGFISRAPLDQFWYVHTADPMLAWLAQNRLLEPATVTDQLRERVNDWPIGYVVVHQDFVRRNGGQPLEVSGFFNTLDDVLCPPVIEGDALFYRTRWHPDGCDPRTPPETEPGIYTINVGAAGDERYLGWGWHWAENIAGLPVRWTGHQVITADGAADPGAQIMVDLPPGAYEVTVVMQAFIEPRTVDLRIGDNASGNEVSANGSGAAAAAPVIVGEGGLAPYSFTLPAEVVADGRNVALTLTYDAALIPAEIEQSADQRALAVLVDRIEFRRVE